MGKRIGILGGGQLGRMLIQEALNFAVDIHILDSDPTAPCKHIATSYTEGSITDYDEVIRFGKDKDILSVEIENVNIEALKKLEADGKKVFPQPHILEIIKDKGLQKQFYRDNNIPSSDFELTDEQTSLEDFASKIPFVHKMRTGGYDGKGVAVISTESDLKNVFPQPSVLETLVPFEKELSVIVSRNEKGETAVYPTVECEFNEANLVAFLFSPAEISTEIEEKAKKLAVDVINKLNMVGILAVEMFLLSNGEILVNEVAPRPHNSGHHTIECNITSQFEQHLRSILNWPLGSTKMVQYGAMINLIGEQGFEGRVKYVGLEEAIAIEGVFPHLYGKKMTKPNRKMGHITTTGASLEEAKDLARKVKSLVRCESDEKS